MNAARQVQYVMQDKAVLVTGAASGIGCATAALFAASGARVMMADLNAAALATVGRELGAVPGHSVATLQTDVTDSASCAQLVDSTVALLGGLDVVCNVAGVLTVGATAELSDDRWRQAIDVNLTGPFFVSRSAIPHLLATQGCIVNVASTAGLAGVPYGAAYSASKAGVIGLTKAMAAEYARRGVRVNAVCPGQVATPMTAGGAGFGNDVDAELMARLSPLTGQPSAADDIARAIAFLASAPNTTGAVLAVDGGQTAI